jgi:hypothetical protein
MVSSAQKSTLPSSRLSSQAIIGSPLILRLGLGLRSSTLDVDRFKLVGGPDQSGPPGVKGLVPDIPLRYGTDYDFRVRLMDHTGGGPQVDGGAHQPRASTNFNYSFRALDPSSSSKNCQPSRFTA